MESGPHGSLARWMVGLGGIGLILLLAACPLLFLIAVPIWIVWGCKGVVGGDLRDEAEEGDVYGELERKNDRIEEAWRDGRKEDKRLDSELSVTMRRPHSGFPFISGEHTVTSKRKKKKRKKK